MRDSIRTLYRLTHIFEMLPKGSGNIITVTGGSVPLHLPAAVRLRKREWELSQAWLDIPRRALYPN